VFKLCNAFTYKAPCDTLKLTPLYTNTTGEYGILFNIDKPKLRLHIKKKRVHGVLMAPVKAIQ